MREVLTAIVFLAWAAFIGHMLLEQEECEREMVQRMAEAVGELARTMERAGMITVGAKQAMDDFIKAWEQTDENPV